MDNRNPPPPSRPPPLFRMRNLRNGNDELQPEDEVVVDPQTMRRFIIQVYLVAGGLCLISAIPWIILSAVHVNVYQHIPVPPFVWALFAFVLLTVLSCIPLTPRTALIVWTLVLCSVFFVTVFGAYYMYFVTVWDLLICMLFAIVLLVLLHVYGAKAPMFLLPKLMCTCCVVLVGMIILLVLLILIVVTGDPGYNLAFGVVFCFIVSFLAIIQAMLIWGRLRYVPLWETVGCANGIYLHFVFLLSCGMIFLAYFARMESPLFRKSSVKYG